MNDISNERLNRLAAELIGWTESDEWYYHSDLGAEIHWWLSPDGERKLSFPNFCSSDCPHSLMAQLLTKVEEKQAHPAYLNELRALASPADMWPEIVTLRWNEAIASPRIKTLSALKACGALPID